jgi:nitric-oxide synthase
VQERYCLVVLLLDLLDASATLLGSLRTLVGANPLLLVATKADLLPAGASHQRLGPWLLQLARAKRLSVAGVHVVSSATGEGALRAAWRRLQHAAPAARPASGSRSPRSRRLQAPSGCAALRTAGLQECMAAITAERKGRDLYVMGAANVGKTAFVSALLRAAGAAGQLVASSSVPLQSGMPGTTLGMLPVAAFGTGGLLYGRHGARHAAAAASAAPAAPVLHRRNLNRAPKPPPPPCCRWLLLLLPQTPQACTSRTAPCTCCPLPAWRRSTSPSSCSPT